MRGSMSEKLLSDELTSQLKNIFTDQLSHPTEILHFTSEEPCLACEAIDQLLSEIASLSDLINYRKYYLSADSRLAEQYHVELAPSLVIAGREGEQILDFGIRFAGLPSGYEFSSLIQVIILASKRDSGLKSETRKALSNLSEPVHLKVFVTPT